MWLEKTSSSIDSQNLLSNFPFLEDYSDYLKDAKVMWEWNYWVVVDWWYERIYKIWRNKDFSDDLKSEYWNHVKFYMWLEKLKSIDWNSEKYKNIRIPEVIKNPFLITWKVTKDKLFIYEMEKIHWNNLLSYLIKEELEKIWIKLDLKDFTDREMEMLYTKHIWKWINALRNWQYMDLTEMDRKFIKSVQRWLNKSVWNAFPSFLFKRYFPDLYEQISQALFELKKSWYKHTDLHAKNLMISFDENNNPIVYLIDFWIVDIKKWL